jgi:hypothetical protein
MRDVAIVEQPADIERGVVVEKADFAVLRTRAAFVGLLLRETGGGFRPQPRALVERAVDDDRPAVRTAATRRRPCAADRSSIPENARALVVREAKSAASNVSVRTMAPSLPRARAQSRSQGVSNCLET